MSIKAYKAFNEDLTCRDFQYEIGKTYTMDEEPVPYVSGFYACENLDDVFIYYTPWANKKVRICEVELDGTIIKSNRKYVANKITIVKEIDYSIFKATSKNSYHRMMAIHYGTDEDLDILVTDDSSHVRNTIACQGRDKDLDILVNDDSYVVRAAVATQGRPQDLDILVNDENPDVRAAVAMQGRDKDLDFLANDDSYIVRMAVAGQEHRKDLDIYIRAIVSHKLKEIHNTNQNTN